MNGEDLLVLGALTQIFRDVFRVEPSVISFETTPADVEAWDSLNHLQLIVAVEERFGVFFDPDEIVSLDSVGKMVEKIVEKRCQ